MKTKHSPSFSVSRFESDIIDRLADRAIVLAEKHGVDYDKLSATMDLTACHCNGMPLDLAKMEAAPDADFAHDIFGILRHINRRTGEIEGCFVPRCALAT